jgi:regulator of protease activity HflC (stomatin/prohibitin superfamily)
MTLPVIILIVVLLALSGLRVAHQYQRAVVLRLGEGERAGGRSRLLQRGGG